MKLFGVLFQISDARDLLKESMMLVAEIKSRMENDPATHDPAMVGYVKIGKALEASYDFVHI